MEAKLSGLGKGLDEIFDENVLMDNSLAEYIKISKIEPNKNQPRKEFNLENLRKLADSIKQYGVLQPLLIKPIKGTDSYQIIAGERRWRAARMAGKTEVPVIVKELTDIEQAEISLIENLQREDLSPLEEAQGYKSLIEVYSLTQEQISKRVGKSRCVVTNALRLLSLPEEIKDLLNNEKITVGHARTLLSVKDENQMIKLCNLVIEKGLSVRELESLCRKLNEKSQKRNSGKIIIKNPIFIDIETSLEKALGRKVAVISKNSNKGVLQLEFYGCEDLLNLVKTFSTF